MIQAAKLRLYSNSSLSDYKTCPRLFFYKYIMEWRASGEEIPLIFGGAWHRAQDAIWRGFADKLDKRQIIQNAYDAFVREWVEAGLPPPNQMGLEAIHKYGARTPMQAHEMIIAYVHKRAAMWEGGEIELIDVERPFAVPLDPEDETLFYVGKIDKVIRRRNKFGGIEHKTTSSYKKEGGFKNAFLDSYHLNAQVDGYLYALHMTYTAEDIFGVWVDAALVHKSEEEFKFIPVEKQIASLDQWLGETRAWVGAIENDMADAALLDERDPYMVQFKRNTDSCVDFNRTCAFMDICKVKPNPIGMPMPSGFVKEPWDPLEHLNRDRLQLPGVKDGN